jgi:hypothetical protein
MSAGLQSFLVFLFCSALFHENAKLHASRRPNEAKIENPKEGP